MLEDNRYRGFGDIELLRTFSSTKRTYASRVIPLRESLRIRDISRNIFPIFYQGDTWDLQDADDGLLFIIPRVVRHGAYK